MPLADPDYFWLCFCFSCMATARSAGALGFQQPEDNTLLFQRLLRESSNESSGKKSRFCYEGIVKIKSSSHPRRQTLPSTLCLPCSISPSRTEIYFSFRRKLTEPKAELQMSEEHILRIMHKCCYCQSAYLEETVASTDDFRIYKYQNEIMLLS